MENINIQKTKLFKFVLLKSYFDTGYSWLSWPKYIIILIMGADIIASKGQNILRLIIFGILYTFICFILGRIIFLKRFREAELEVVNIFNPFVKEVRENIENSDKRKIFK